MCGRYWPAVPCFGVPHQRILFGRDCKNTSVNRFLPDSHLHVFGS